MVAVVVVVVVVVVLGRLHLTEKQAIGVRAGSISIPF